MISKGQMIRNIIWTIVPLLILGTIVCAANLPGDASPDSEPESKFVLFTKSWCLALFILSDIIFAIWISG